MFLFTVDPGLFIPMILFLFLTVAAVYDATTGEIPIYLFPVLWAFCLPFTFFSYQFNLLDSIIGCLISVGVFFVLAVFFNGGGGDILMMGAVGWCLGICGTVYLILLSSLLYLIFSFGVFGYRLIKRKPLNILTQQYPYAPFVLCGYIVQVLFSIAQ